MEPGEATSLHVSCQSAALLRAANHRTLRAGAMPSPLRREAASSEGEAASEDLSKALTSSTRPNHMIPVARKLTAYSAKAGMTRLLKCLTSLCAVTDQEAPRMHWMTGLPPSNSVGVYRYNTGAGIRAPKTAADSGAAGAAAPRTLSAQA